MWWSAICVARFLHSSSPVSPRWRVIDFIADCPETSTVRLLLGTEPFESRHQSFRIGHHSFCSPRQVPINDAGVSLGQVVIAAARGLGQ